MDRFFADRIVGDEAYIDSEEESKHIKRVLRMKEGDLVEIFDGNGREYIARLEDLSQKSLELKIIEAVDKERELKTSITVYQGIPKAQKMELIVQKLTEIGVSRIVPLKLSRCVKIIDEKENKQIARWSKIALEAAKQSKRTRIPEIEKVMDIKDLVEDMKNNDLTLVLYEEEETLKIKDILKSVETKNAKIGIIVGPEGGITGAEKEQIASAGAKSVLLGNRILRTETAAIYGASIISYELE